MSFLPDNYEKPVSDSKYMKLKIGGNKFRILSDAIIGWIDWDKSDPKKPVPVRTKEKLSPLGDSKVKHFWAFIVFDYGDKAIKILEITQSSIQEAIYAYHLNESWGDPKGYDLSINREGDKLETKYQVVPTPPKPLSEDIKNLYESTRINLEALFTGDDPFDTEAIKTPPQAPQSQKTGVDAMREARDNFNTEGAVKNDSFYSGEPEKTINVENIPF